MSYLKSIELHEGLNDQSVAESGGFDSKVSWYGANTNDCARCLLFHEIPDIDVRRVLSTDQLHRMRFEFRCCELLHCFDVTTKKFSSDIRRVQRTKAGSLRSNSGVQILVSLESELSDRCQPRGRLDFEQINRPTGFDVDIGERVLLGYVPHTGHGIRIITHIILENALTLVRSSSSLQTFRI